MSRLGAHRRRRGRWLLGALFVVGSPALVVSWPWVVAQARTVAVLGELLDVPVLQPVVHALTSEPSSIDIDLDGAAATMVLPGGSDGPWPAMLFISGADAAGRRHKDVVAVADGLARAGFVVIVPDLPDLQRGVFDDQTAARAARVVAAAAGRPEVQGNKIAIASVSAGASLALVVAAQLQLHGKVSVVAGIAPFADLRAMLQLATTGSYRDPDGRLVPYESVERMRTLLARSVLAMLQQRGTGGSSLVGRLQAEAQRVDDPLQPFVQVPQGVLPPDLQAAVAVLANRDPERFEGLFAALPADLRAAVAELSPVTHARDLDMPVLLASAPRDSYFPLDQSRVIVARAPDASLTVLPVLEHAIPDASPGSLRELARFDAWVVCVMRAAAAD